MFIRNLLRDTYPVFLLAIVMMGLVTGKTGHSKVEFESVSKIMESIRNSSMECLFGGRQSENLCSAGTEISKNAIFESIHI